MRFFDAHTLTLHQHPPKSKDLVTTAYVSSGAQFRTQSTNNPASHIYLSFCFFYVIFPLSLRPSYTSNGIFTEYQGAVAAGLVTSQKMAVVLPPAAAAAAGSD